MARRFSGAGVPLSMQGAPTNTITLPAGACYYFNSNQNPSVPGQGTGNAGEMQIKLGRYTVMQVQDPITQIWRGIGDDSNAQRFAYSDGVNVRLANQSGCAVAAVVTTNGSGYVTPPTVVASAGSSIWKAVLGPYVSAATVIYGGTNYTYPPIVIIDAPPVGGVPASAQSVITAGAVTSITINDMGAGYNSGVPLIRLVNDIRDSTGSGAQATAVTTGAGVVAALLCLDHGSPITSGTVPTLTFGSGSAAATVLMNWGITTYAATTPGAGYGNSATIGLTAVGPAVITPSSVVNPSIDQKLVRVRKADIWVPTNSTGGLTLAGQIVDGGVYAGIPTPVYTVPTTPSTVGALGLTMGGFNDTSFIQPW